MSTKKLLAWNMKPWVFVLIMGWLVFTPSLRVFCPDKPREDWRFTRTSRVQEATSSFLDKRNIEMQITVFKNKTKKQSVKKSNNKTKLRRERLSSSIPIFSSANVQFHAPLYSSVLKYRPVNCAFKREKVSDPESQTTIPMVTVSSLVFVGRFPSQWLYAVVHNPALVSVSERHDVKQPCTGRRLLSCERSSHHFFGTAQCWM